MATRASCTGSIDLAGRVTRRNRLNLDRLLASAQRALEPWDHRLTDELSFATEIFDAHLHLGRDVDGLIGDYEELIRMIDSYGVESGFVFCLHELDREPAFRAANDRTLAFAERSGGRLIPFARLDLNETPLEEAERCLALGARGIKLHPRAQRFRVADERLRAVVSLAEDRGVPVLLHAGQGLPPIADELARVMDLHPSANLILAHAGIADLPSLCERLAGRPGVFFDSSVWSVADLLACLELVPPEQILYASDYPYSQPPASLLLTVRSARVAGASDEVLRAMLYGNARAISEGHRPGDPTSPLPVLPTAQAPTLARAGHYIAMALALYRADQPHRGTLELAISATSPGGIRDEELEDTHGLLVAARQLWTALPDLEADQRYAADRMTSRLLHLACVTCATSGAPSRAE